MLSASNPYIEFVFGENKFQKTLLCELSFDWKYNNSEEYSNAYYEKKNVFAMTTIPFAHVMS